MGARAEIDGAVDGDEVLLVLALPHDGVDGQAAHRGVARLDRPGRLHRLERGGAEQVCAPCRRCLAGFRLGREIEADHVIGPALVDDDEAAIFEAVLADLGLALKAQIAQIGLEFARRAAVEQAALGRAEAGRVSADGLGGGRVRQQECGGGSGGGGGGEVAFHRHFQGRAFAAVAAGDTVGEGCVAGYSINARRKSIAIRRSVRGQLHMSRLSGTLAGLKRAVARSRAGSGLSS